MTSRKGDKMLTDLHRLLDTQDFKTKEEVELFLNNMKNEPIPEFDREALTDQEIAQDLVFEAPCPWSWLSFIAISSITIPY
jgi:hypothetical protein